MPLLDKITDLAAKFGPSKGFKSSLSGGIGSGHGMVAPGDDMIVSKPTIVFHSCQIFFNFIAMCCFAGVASFQAKWGVGPSGLTGFAIFVSITGILLSAFMLLVPVAYEKYDKFVRLARALKEVRVGFILTGTGVTFSLLIAFITTISVFTQPGCKNADNDPHAEDKGDDFKRGLPGWCNTKKAGSIFFWFAFMFWIASLVFLILEWRSGKLHVNPQRDPPFSRPQQTHDEEEAEDEEDGYTHVASGGRTNVNTASGGRYDSSNAEQSPFADPQQRYQGGSSTPSAYTPAPVTSHAGRPSMDAYGAFSDPAPTGFGAASSIPEYGRASAAGYHNTASSQRPGPPVLPEGDFGKPVISRTMQYADPYAAVHASIAGAGPTSPTIAAPPTYESYSGYR